MEKEVLEVMEKFEELMGKKTKREREMMVKQLAKMKVTARMKNH